MDDLPPDEPQMLPPGGINTAARPGLTPPETFAPSAQAPAPTEHHGLLRRLLENFGAPRVDPTIAGAMSPEQQNYLRSQGQAGLASALLQASGPRPQGTANFPQRVGEAFGASQANWQQIQDRGVQALQLARQMATQRAVAGIQAKYAPKQGETPPEVYARLSQMVGELASVPGAEAAVGHYAPILEALKPHAGVQREPLRIDKVRDNDPSSPTRGQVGTILLDPLDYRRIGFVPQVQESDKVTSTAQREYREQAQFGAAAVAAWKPVEEIRRNNPGVEAEVGKIITSPAFVQAVPMLHSAGDAVRLLRAGGASEAAQQYMRAKIDWLASVERTQYKGARGVTGVLLSMYMQRYMPGLDELGNEQMRQNEIQAMITAQGLSGYEDHPEFWNSAAKAHGVEGVDLSKILAGAPIDEAVTNRLDAIRRHIRQKP